MFKMKAGVYQDIKDDDMLPVRRGNVGNLFSSNQRSQTITDTRRITYGKFAGCWSAVTDDLVHCNANGYGNASVELNIIKDGMMQTIADVIVHGPESDVNEFWQRFADRHNL